LAGAWSGESRARAQDADLKPEPPPAGLEVALDAPAGSDMQPVSAEELSHLDLWMEYLGKSARRGRLMNGSMVLAAGSLVTAIGVSFYVSTPLTELDKGLGLAFVGIGGIYTAMGIARLAKKSAGEALRAEWRAAKHRTLTLRELGRFEGELRGYSRLLRRASNLGRWTSFGMGMTGVLILGITPAANLSTDAATTGYVLGGILAGAGLLSFSFTFVKSANVDYWASYQKGRPPPGRTWSAAPSFGRSYAGLRVVGRF